MEVGSHTLRRKNGTSPSDVIATIVQVAGSGVARAGAGLLSDVEVEPLPEPDPLSERETEPLEEPVGGGDGVPTLIDVPLP